MAGSIGGGRLDRPGRDRCAARLPGAEAAFQMRHRLDPHFQQAARGEVLFVDLRDVRELEREGVIPGAVHAPRGMLEFWVDPESPYHREVFAPGRPLLLFCAAGWRSALAARSLMEMGVAPVAHLEGGFDAWKAAGAPVAARPVKAPAAD